jgi:hypothetical protein
MSDHRNPTSLRARRENLTTAAGTQRAGLRTLASRDPDVWKMLFRASNLFPVTCRFASACAALAGPGTTAIE